MNGLNIWTRVFIAKSVRLFMSCKHVWQFKGFYMNISFYSIYVGLGRFIIGSPFRYSSMICCKYQNNIYAFLKTTLKVLPVQWQSFVLHWRHNERDGVSNHQPHYCLLECLFNVEIKENIKVPRHWPLCGEFTIDRWIPRTKASNTENVSI